MFSGIKNIFYVILYNIVITDKKTYVKETLRDVAMGQVGQELY
jgi:hypothetical protein